MTGINNITVLILGGLCNDRTRHLLTFLVSSSPRPIFIRIVDKYLIIPQADAYTTYVDQATREALKSGVKDGVVQYVQGNLLTEATRTSAFTLPDPHGGPTKGFDVVYDLTGEDDFALPDAVHIERTLRLALLLGQAAVQHHAGVYVRALSTLYQLPGGKKGKVGEGEAGAEPWGVRAKWFHEAARGLALIPGLKLVLVRPALMYGPYSVTGFTPQLLIGEVYKYQGEKLEFLWADSLAQNTVHAHDFASACVAIALWALPLPRAEILQLAGEDLNSTLASNALVEPIPGAAKKEETGVRAAVFNVVDEGETTQGSFAKIISEVVGVEAGFHGSLISTFAKMNMGDVIEDVNEKHLEGWSLLLTASNPPISTTVPISPNVAADLLQPYPINLSGEKLATLVGWKPEYSLTPEVVRDTVTKFKAEGHWPNAAPLKQKKK